MRVVLNLSLGALGPVSSVDAHDSGSCGRKAVLVRFQSRALRESPILLLDNRMGLFPLQRERARKRVLIVKPPSFSACTLRGDVRTGRLPVFQVPSQYSDSTPRTGSPFLPKGFLELTGSTEPASLGRHAQPSPHVQSLSPRPALRLWHRGSSREEARSLVCLCLPRA